MKKFLITEEEKLHIKKLYNITEIDSNKALKGLQDFVSKYSTTSTDSSSSTTSPQSTDSSSTTSSDTTTNVEAGDYFVHPNAESISLNYLPNAIKLNQHAETLLKSIFAEAGTTNLSISSTLRTYEDQARVNLQNSRENIAAWYGADVVQVWDKYKAGQMTQQEYANYLKDRDQKRGSILSNHIPGFAIDITPYNEKFASTAEKLMKQGNSGIKKVLREKSNGAVHIEFTFPVTDKGLSSFGTLKGATKRSEKRADKAVSKSGIIVDKKTDSPKYAIVFGGSPSGKYGAQFMYQEGTNIFKNKNIVYSDFENSLDSVINHIKSIVPNVEITSVSGFSAGGRQAWDAAKRGYKAGLIDPVVTNDTFSILGPNLNKELPSNIEMISKESNWGGSYRKHGENLSKIEKVNPKIKKNVVHELMPKEFFKDFESFV